jgi:hypothetical protein
VAYAPLEVMGVGALTVVRMGIVRVPATGATVFGRAGSPFWEVVVVAGALLLAAAEEPAAATTGWVGVGRFAPVGVVAFSFPLPFDLALAVPVSAGVVVPVLSPGFAFRFFAAPPAVESSVRRARPLEAAGVGVLDGRRMDCAFGFFCHLV